MGLLGSAHTSLEDVVPPAIQTVHQDDFGKASNGQQRTSGRVGGIAGRDGCG